MGWIVTYEIAVDPETLVEDDFDTKRDALESVKWRKIDGVLGIAPAAGDRIELATGEGDVVKSWIFQLVVTAPTRGGGRYRWRVES